MPQKGTRPEKRLEFALRALGAPPWESSPRDIHGAPDLLWRGQEVYVYVDGCQWHACPQHFRPHSGGDESHGLTARGASMQRHRDSLVRRANKAQGKTVLAFWEHEINRDAGKCAALVMSALEARERCRPAR